MHTHSQSRQLNTQSSLLLENSDLKEHSFYSKSHLFPAVFLLWFGHVPIFALDLKISKPNPDIFIMDKFNSKLKGVKTELLKLIAHCPASLFLSVCRYNDRFLLLRFNTSQPDDLGPLWGKTSSFFALTAIFFTWVLREDTHYNYYIMYRISMTGTLPLSLNRLLSVVQRNNNGFRSLASWLSQCPILDCLDYFKYLAKNLILAPLAVILF